MQKPILIAAMVALSSPAPADEGLPRYDVEAVCSAPASVLGNSAYAKTACFEQEQNAYDSLKARWVVVPAEVRTVCQKMAGWIGSGSYTVLVSCVDIETEARSRGTPTFKF